MIYLIFVPSRSLLKIDIFSYGKRFSTTKIDFSTTTTLIPQKDNIYTLYSQWMKLYDPLHPFLWRKQNLRVHTKRSKIAHLDDWKFPLFFGYILSASFFFFIQLKIGLLLTVFCNWTFFLKCTPPPPCLTPSNFLPIRILSKKCEGVRVCVLGEGGLHFYMENIK